MPSPLLRPGVQTDANDLLALHRRSILQLGPSGYTKAECESWASGLTATGYIDAMTGGGETYLVAEVSGNVAGFCSYKANEVIGLYVDPKEARRGVGSMLLCEAEAAIVRCSETSIKLSAALTAKKFYQSHHYEVRFERLWKTRGGLEILVCGMEKCIVQPLK